MLWGKAAGRCEFWGCNRVLSRSSVTQEQVNVAQKAHIYSISADGPRGNEGIDKAELNSLSNLMLVCHECHQKLDKSKDGGRYTVELLQGWKTAHEARVELVTGVSEDRRSHILLYGTNVGAHSSPLTFSATAPRLFPERYPAEPNAIELGMVNSAWTDCDAEFWTIETGNLVRQFDQKVRDRLADGTITHLSVFGLAPQPLLILLGALLTDIPEADVFQLHREPQGWGWSPVDRDCSYFVREPKAMSSKPALVLSLSARITHDRVQRVLGEDTAIWELSIAEPHNDFLQTRRQLQLFRQAVRPLMDRIKTAHGQTTPIAIFPAMPSAAAIELGRIRMPKADAPWHVYDQVNKKAGFLHALSIPSESED